LNTFLNTWPTRVSVCETCAQPAAPAVFTL